MESALQNGQFEIYLQPKIAPATGELTGAEALIRWNHPQRGIIPSSRFISLFERNRLIAKLDHFVFHSVCDLFESWKNQGLPLLPVSVNLSRYYLEDSAYLQGLAQYVRRRGIDPSLLELELTESIIFEDSTLLLSVMKRIKRMGFKLSMDDFGTGYSSLNLLKDLPLDVIKVDRAFFNFSGMSESRSCIVIKNIIHMARELNIAVVSEGVETAAQARFLQGIGCGMAQSYFFARPLPIAQYLKFKQNAEGAHARLSSIL